MYESEKQQEQALGRPGATGAGHGCRKEGRTDGRTDGLGGGGARRARGRSRAAVGSDDGDGGGKGRGAPRLANRRGGARWREGGREVVDGGRDEGGRKAGKAD